MIVRGIMASISGRVVELTSAKAMFSNSMPIRREPMPVPPMKITASASTALPAPSCFPEEPLFEVAAALPVFRLANLI
jgi:hypothetical protein